MTYPYYAFGEFSDLSGRKYRLDVLRRDWDQSPELLEIEQGSVELNFEAEEPFDVVNPSSLSATFLLQDPTFFRALFTADDELFRLRLTELKSGGDKVLWEGNILPDEYDETYKEPPIKANVTAVDIFGVLNQKYLDEYDGFMTVGNLIAKCLAKARRDPADTYMFNDFFYERLLSRPDHVSFSEPLLANIYHNLNNYTKRSLEEPDEEDFDCLKIIKTALRPYGAVIQRDVGGALLIFEPQARASQNANIWDEYQYGVPTGNQPVKSLFYDINFKAGSGYDKLTMHFPVLRDQKLNIAKAIKTAEVDFEATKTRARSFIYNGLFRKYDESNQTLDGWLINDPNAKKVSHNPSAYGITFEIRPTPQIHNERIEPRDNQDLVIDGSTNYGNSQYIDSRQRVEPFGNMLTLTNPVYGFNYQPHDRNTQDDFIQMKPARIPADKMEFGMKWQFPTVAVTGGTNFNIREWSQIKLQISLTNTQSGDQYRIQYNPYEEKYEFQKPANYGAQEYFYFETSSDERQEQRIEFDVPEVGDLILTIFGFEPHTGDTDNAQEVKYLSGELNIWDLDLRVAEKDEETINKTRKGNDDITYSTDKMKTEVIHWDHGNISSSTGDVTKDENFNNTGGWTREGLDNNPVTLLENLANLQLDTFSRPLRLISGTFNMPSIHEFLRNSYRIDEGGQEFIFYPVSGKLDLCNGFGELKLKQIGEPSDADFDPNKPPDYDEPEIPRRGDEPPVSEGPGMDNFGGTGPTDEGFATPVLSSNLQRSRRNMVKMGPEPFDPPPGFSVEWLDDGSYAEQGSKFQKFKDGSGNIFVNKLGG